MPRPLDSERPQGLPAPPRVRPTPFPRTSAEALPGLPAGAASGDGHADAAVPAEGGGADDAGLPAEVVEELATLSAEERHELLSRKDSGFYSTARGRTIE